MTAVSQPLDPLVVLPDEMSDEEIVFAVVQLVSVQAAVVLDLTQQSLVLVGEDY